MYEQKTHCSTPAYEAQSGLNVDLLKKYNIPEHWYPSCEAQELVGLLDVDIDRKDGAAVDHAYRSLGILAKFCKTLDPKRRQAMADAMLLHDVPGRTFHRESEERAILSDLLQEGWRDYIQQTGENYIDQSTVDYMHDQVVIGMDARNYRESIKLQPNGISVHDKEMINDSSYDGMVNVAGWHMDMPKIRISELYDLAKRINIESLVIKSAEMLDNIKNPPEQDSQQLRNILEAESFYIPLLETIGYDAMAAEMASVCHIYRLRGQGNADIIKRAAEIYRENAEKDPADLAMQLFGLSEKPDIHWIVNKTSDDIYSGINCRFAELIVPIAGVSRRVLFRQKSIGSMAKKMSLKGNDYNVMDTFAFQVICTAEDDTLDKKHHYEMTDAEIKRIHVAQTEDLANVFNSFVETVSGNESLQLKSTNGVRKPIFIQGDANYVNTVYEGLSLEYAEVVGREFRDAEVPYRVSKATAFVNGLPVEVQVVTDVDRKLGRTGATSHAASYKNQDDDKTNDSLRRLQEIHRRVEHMKYGDGNPISRAMGEQALRAVMRRIYSKSFAPERLYSSRVDGRTNV